MDYRNSYTLSLTDKINMGVTNQSLPVTLDELFGNISSEAINTTEHHVVSWSFYIETSLLIFVTVLTVFGNLAIIGCVALHSRLQRPSHIFIASLATADLLLGLTVMVPRLSSEILHKWYFGYFLCQVYHAMDVTLCTSSILHLCCISVDRYYAIVDRPLLYYDRVTTPKVVLAVLGSWVLAGFVPVFTGIYSSNEHLEKSIETGSTECDLAVNKIFSVLAGLISFWIPAAVIVYVYAMVFRESRRLAGRPVSVSQVVQLAAKARNNHHSRASYPGDSECEQTQQSLVSSSSGPARATSNGELLRKQSEGVTTVLKMKRVSTTSESTIRHHPGGLHSGGGGGHNQAGVHDRESGAATTFGIIVGAFLICWLPFFIWMPLTALLELDTPPLLYNIILWVGYGNSAINPFIYGIFNREFRVILLRHMRKCSRYLWSSDT